MFLCSPKILVFLQRQMTMSATPSMKSVGFLRSLEIERLGGGRRGLEERREECSVNCDLRVSCDGKLRYFGSVLTV